MSQRPLSLRTLSFPLKVLATCFLLTMGIGYLFGVAYLYLTAIQPHANGTLVKAVIVKYHGDRGSSRLEASLDGSMKDYATPDERRRIIEWIRAGAGEAEFADVKPVLNRSCADCHSAEAGMGLAPLFAYTVIGGGALMGLSLAGQILIALYEMWVPADIPGEVRTP